MKTLRNVPGGSCRMQLVTLHWKVGRHSRPRNYNQHQPPPGLPGTFHRLLMASPCLDHAARAQHSNLKQPPCSWPARLAKSLHCLICGPGSASEWHPYWKKEFRWTPQFLGVSCYDYWNPQNKCVGGVHSGNTGMTELRHWCFRLGSAFVYLNSNEAPTLWPNLTIFDSFYGI